MHTLQNLICQVQAYLLLRQIPGTFLAGNNLCNYEVLATVKQLGIPTQLMTLSCADSTVASIVLNYFQNTRKRYC